VSVWEMGIKMSSVDFVYPGGIIISNLGEQSIHPLITALAGLIGAIFGAFITFYLNYAKTKAMMKWEMKFNAYNAIPEFDKGYPINSKYKMQEIRFAKRLKAISENEEIKTIADKMIKGEFKDLEDKQQFMDEQLILRLRKTLKIQ
jgi:hypothetical protein